MLYRIPAGQLEHPAEEILIVIQVLEDDPKKIGQAISSMPDHPIEIYSDDPKTERNIVMAMWQCYCHLASTQEIVGFIKKHFLMALSYRELEGNTFLVRKRGSLTRFQYWKTSPNNGVTSSRMWEEDFIKIFYDFLLSLAKQGIIEVAIIEIPTGDFLSFLSGEEILQRVNNIINKDGSIKDAFVLMNELELNISVTEEKLRRIQEGWNRLCCFGFQKPKRP